MAVIDFIFIAILAIIAVYNTFKGFIGAILSLAAIILGSLAGIFFFRRAAYIMRRWFLEDVKYVPEIIAFIIIFLLVFGVVKIIEIILKNIIENIQFKAADRFLGFLFGIGEGVVIICILLFLINMQNFFESKTILENSLFAKIFMPYLTEYRSSGRFILHV